MSLTAIETMGKNCNSIGKFSIGCNQVLPSLGIIDWSKKRKLEDEQVTLPLSKHKCITQSSDRCREALSFEQEGIESTGSCNQNSLSGLDRYLSTSTMTDVRSPVDSGGEYTELVTRSRESGSSTGSNNSCSDFQIRTPVGSQGEISAFSEDSATSTFRNNLYSLASRTIKRKSEDSEKAETPQCARKKLNFSTKRLNCTDILDREVEFEDVKECLDYETEISYSEYDQLLDLGISYADVIRFQACQDKDNDTSLYFSDQTSLVSLLSSGGWKDEDTVKCERKPTIDQEFEQYFSSLML